MEQINECIKCIELKKSLQAEKKKVSQKNRLITLLRELVRSYEAKDLNLTFTDLTRIYESSSSEVTILKQRLTLYLNENQELLQLKNEISSRNDLLEKKYRDVEDEISHLRFVNKQLGDYYREKEADNDQHKDRLKKLAKKLLCYEPRNSEVRKILNLQNTPIDLDQKPLKNGKKKNEETIKDMKKDNIDDGDDDDDDDDDLITMKSKPSEILNSEDLEMSDMSDCDNDTDCNETNDLLCIEAGSSPPSPEPVLDSIQFTGMPNDLTSQSFDDKTNSEKPSEIISNSGDCITCEESDSSSNCVDIVDHCSFYKHISKESSRSKVDENKINKSSEVHPSIFEEESCTFEDISDQNEVDVNHKDSSDFLEFEGSLPDLISPLKSDEPRVLSYLDCMQILQQERVIQDNFEHNDSNQEVTNSDVNDKNEKVSADIKNECSSNSGDQIEKKKKPPPSMFQSKYQALNESLLFSEKPMNGSHIPLNANYASNYQFQSCCCNSFDARPPVTLKLYNCNNVEISIPPSIQSNNLPIITVRDKCDLDKCFINTSDDVSKPVDPTTVRCSFNTQKRDSQSNNGRYNQPIPTVLSCSRPSLHGLNHNITESIKEPSNPYIQGFLDESKKPDYYFLDYLSKNQISDSNSTFRKQRLSESDCDTVKCSRMFPVKSGQNFDLEHFCYRFGGLSLKYSLPKEACKVTNSEKMNNSNKYPLLFNISQPPVFHNSLKSSISINNKNEWIFGQNFLNVPAKQDVCQKQNNLVSKALKENSPNKLKHSSIVQKAVLDFKTGYINVTAKNKFPSNQSVQHPFQNIHETNGLIRNKDCFKPITVDVDCKKRIFEGKDEIPERRQMIMPQSCMKVPAENNEDISHKASKNNAIKLKSSQCDTKNSNIASETSKSECSLTSNVKGCSKSIFDFDQEKSVLSGKSTTHSTICNNRTNPVAVPLALPQKRPLLNHIQKPHTSTNSHCSPEKVLAEKKSITQTKECLKENLLREKPVLPKEKSPKKIKHSELPHTKNSSVGHDYLFKKPDSVNVKSSSDAKVADKRFPLNPSFSKDVKVDFNEKPTINSPKKVDQLHKVRKKKSSPEIKIHSSKKNFSLQNGGLEKEAKSSSSISLKPGNKYVADIHKNSINIGSAPVSDEEEKFDNELQEIFKEMEHITVPLLSPLRKTPEIPGCVPSGVCAEETPRPKMIEDNAVEDLEKEDKKVKSREEIESKDVEDEQINTSLEKSVINQEIIPKCDLINSRFKDETINQSIQSFSSSDENKYKLFSDNDKIDSLEEETNMIDEIGGVNNDFLEDMEIESCSKTEVNPVSESTEIGNFTKTQDVKIYSRKRKKIPDTINESKNYAPFPSLMECKSKVSEETIPATDSNCPSKDVQPSVVDNKAKLCSHTEYNDKTSIGLGFYVNRCDEESTSNVSVSSLPEVEKLESPTVSNDLISDTFNASTEEISFDDGCSPESCSVLPNEEAMQEGKEISLEKEESLGNKRKFSEINGQIEGMCSKKQKKFSDDKYISCESDVFICALRYLSAAAIASSDGKVCSLPKINADNLATKIAINHIKNLIIEALQSIDINVYDVLNCSVKKMHQINDASPTSLAKAIIELITESNDKSEAKDKPYMPNMTKTVKMCLLTAVSFIGYNRDFVMKFCEVFEQYISSFYDKSLRVAEGSQLVIFYTSFCRSYNLDDKVKYMIYDVLYTRNIKAYPMVYKAIQTWPDILPHSDTCFAKDCLLTQTIIFILLSGASSVDEKVGSMYCINNIRSYLFKYFGYKCNFIRREELTDKIIENICVKGCSVALVLLCKCEPWEWSLNVVEKKLLPILQNPRNMDESTVCEYILTVGRVVRGFPITKAGYIVKNTLEVFERMLLESNSNHLSEIIIEAISLLRRHNLMKCTSILMNWKPNTKQITEKTINHISTILRVKNVGYWKNVYSAHSSNIIHNTRMFRKKRKPGFISPA